MIEIPEFGAVGERARLFPVLAETSKEGRTLSIVLACLSQVPEFADKFLSSQGRRVGKQTNVETFTEVTFPRLKELNFRPDGLIIARTGRSTWSALVEAKVGNNVLKKDQIEAYLKIAKQAKIDAVITISNDFVAQPGHHPVKVDARLCRKVSLSHFSWFALLTDINLLALNDEIDDTDHRFLLGELERFLLHKSAGLKRFDDMGAAWPKVIDGLRTPAGISKASDDVSAVVGSWHSEVRDLCLLLARKTSAQVSLKLSRRLATDSAARFQDDCKSLADDGTLEVSVVVADAAAPILIVADLAGRTLRASMNVDAPGDKQTQKGRLNWLVRQLEDADEETLIISNWRGRIAGCTSTLNEARDDWTLHSHPDRAQLPQSFTVMKLMRDGKAFAARKKFIERFEAFIIDDFYGDIATKVKQWQAPPRELRRAVEEPPE